MIDYSISEKGRSRWLSSARGGRSVSRCGHWGERKKRLLGAVGQACWGNVPGMEGSVRSSISYQNPELGQFSSIFYPLTEDQ